MKPAGSLETVLYAPDLDAAEGFYAGILGLKRVARDSAWHVFFRCGNAMLLVFDPAETRNRLPGPLPVPVHGAEGPGHVAVRATAAGIDGWRAHVAARCIAIETEFDWPQGGRSLHVRDPAGNSVEFAEPRLRGLA